VRQTVGHDNHVAFADAAALTILDFCASNLVGSYGFLMERCAPGNESGGAFQDIDDVGVADMDFCNARGLSPAGMDFELGVSTRGIPLVKAAATALLPMKRTDCGFIIPSQEPPESAAALWVIWLRVTAASAASIRIRRRGFD
jgi:hypothetical protein